MPGQRTPSAGPHKALGISVGRKTQPKSNEERDSQQLAMKVADARKQASRLQTLLGPFDAAAGTCDATAPAAAAPAAKAPEARAVVRGGRPPPQSQQRSVSGGANAPKAGGRSRLAALHSGGRNMSGARLVSHGGDEEASGHEPASVAPEVAPTAAANDTDARRDGGGWSCSEAAPAMTQQPTYKQQPERGQQLVEPECVSAPYALSAGQQPVLNAAMSTQYPGGVAGPAAPSACPAVHGYACTPVWPLQSTVAAKGAPTDAPPLASQPVAGFPVHSTAALCAPLTEPTDRYGQSLAPAVGGQSPWQWLPPARPTSGVGTSGVGGSGAAAAFAISAKPTHGSCGSDKSSDRSRKAAYAAELRLQMEEARARKEAARRQRALEEIEPWWGDARDADAGSAEGSNHVAAGGTAAIGGGARGGKRIHPDRTRDFEGSDGAASLLYGGRPASSAAIASSPQAPTSACASAPSYSALLVPPPAALPPLPQPDAPEYLSALSEQLSQLLQAERERSAALAEALATELQRSQQRATAEAAAEAASAARLATVAQEWEARLAAAVAEASAQAAAHASIEAKAAAEACAAELREKLARAEAMAESHAAEAQAEIARVHAECRVLVAEAEAQAQRADEDAEATWKECEARVEEVHQRMREMSIAHAKAVAAVGAPSQHQRSLAPPLGCVEPKRGWHPNEGPYDAFSGDRCSRANSTRWHEGDGYGREDEYDESHGMHGVHGKMKTDTTHPIASSEDDAVGGGEVEARHRRNSIGRRAARRHGNRRSAAGNAAADGISRDAPRHASASGRQGACENARASTAGTLARHMESCVSENLHAEVVLQNEPGYTSWDENSYRVEDARRSGESGRSDDDDGAVSPPLSRDDGTALQCGDGHGGEGSDPALDALLNQYLNHMRGMSGDTTSSYDLRRSSGGPSQGLEAGFGYGFVSVRASHAADNEQASGRDSLSSDASSAVSLSKPPGILNVPQAMHGSGANLDDSSAEMFGDGSVSSIADEMYEAGACHVQVTTSEIDEDIVPEESESPKR